MMADMSASLKVVSMAAVRCASSSRLAIVWRLGRGGGGALGNGCEHVARMNRLSLTSGDLAEHAGLVSGDVDVDLLSLELHERLASFHLVALALQPGADRRLDDRFTQRWD